MQTSSNDPQWYITIKPYFEIAYFFSGVLLALFSSLIFMQIKLAKKSLLASMETINIAKRDISTRVQRDSMKLAMKISKDFLDANTIFVQKENNNAFNIHFTKWELCNDNFDNTSIINKKEYDRWISIFKKINKCSYTTIIEYLNNIEAIALYITKGIADEEIAFLQIGSVFCDQISELAPIIILKRLNSFDPPEHKYYCEIVQLYSLWSKKNKTFSLEVKKREIELELEKSQCTNKIKLVGTDN